MVPVPVRIEVLVTASGERETKDAHSLVTPEIYFLTEAEEALANALYKCPTVRWKCAASAC